MRTFYLSTDTITEDMILASKDEFNAIGIEFEKIDDHYKFMHKLNEADHKEHRFRMFNLDPIFWEEDDDETYFKFHIDGIGRTWECKGENSLTIDMMRIRFEQIFRTKFFFEMDEERLEENGIFFENLDDGYEIWIKDPINQTVGTRQSYAEWDHTFHLIQKDQKEAA